MQDPAVLFFDELSRCDNKGLNLQPVKGNSLQVGPWSARMNFSASADALKRSVVTVGTEHEEMETVAADSRVDEGHDLMLQVVD